MAEEKKMMTPGEALLCLRRAASVAVEVGYEDMLPDDAIDRASVLMNSLGLMDRALGELKILQTKLMKAGQEMVTLENKVKKLEKRNSKPKTSVQKKRKSK